MQAEDDSKQTEFRPPAKRSISREIARHPCPNPETRGEIRVRLSLTVLVLAFTSSETNSENPQKWPLEASDIFWEKSAIPMLFNKHMSRQIYCFGLRPHKFGSSANNDCIREVKSTGVLSTVCVRRRLDDPVRIVA